MLLSFASQFKGETQDTIDAAPREHGLLDGHLVVGALVEASADIRVFAFIVFANDSEVDFTGLPMFQRRFDPIEKAHGAKIDVLPERAPDRNQKPPQRDMIGNAGVANRPEEDAVERPQLTEAVVRHHFPGLLVGFAAPIKGLPMAAKLEALASCFEDANAFGNHFFADAVSGDDRDLKGFHGVRFILFPLLTAALAERCRERFPTPL